MDNELQLTARGHAVCELMLGQRLTLEDACARIDFELEALRQKVDSILSGNSWEDVAQAMQHALNGFSLYVQAAYFEEHRAPEAPSTLRA
ncbi:MAG: hypothetical protein ABJB12_13730 [Pseudomonadota bacterium]